MMRPNILIRQIVILQLLIVVVVSAFGGDTVGWKHVPEIPAGRRAQYLLLKRDGGYKYGYDTGEGSSASQSASADNEVTGNYAYQGGDGQQQAFQYTSGINGFVPNLSSARKLTGSSISSSVASKSSYDAPSESEESSGDSSYNFSFDAGNFQQQEKSDNAHNVVGSYQYTDNDGLHRVQYSAAPETGFLANVDGVQYPGEAVVEGGVQKSSQGPSYPTYNKPLSIPISNSLQQVSESYYPSQNIADKSSGDASYSFSYSSDAHSREESSDSGGNVQGTYSYVDPTGTRQQIDYTAGDNTGFVVTKSSTASVPPTSSFSMATDQQTNVLIPPSAYIPISKSPDYDKPDLSDASYSFAYQSSDQSKQESSDSIGNVKGSFSFAAKDDGVTRTVNYIAGADTGFVASGAHLPRTNQQSHSNIPLSEKTFESTAQSRSKNLIPNVPTAKHIPPVSVPLNSGGSYSFYYDAGDHSRTESSDLNGNVKGTYSFIAKDDGITRKVDYSASSDTGFVANVSPSSHNVKPSSKSSPPLVPGSPPESVTKIITSYSPVSPSARVIPQPSYTPYVPPSDVSPLGIDGSYSFAYDTADHSRSETGDASGNVQGSFSFIAKDDNQQRRVDYVAGANTGFLASGTHLPTPVPAQTHAVPIPSAAVDKVPSFEIQAAGRTPPVSQISGIQSGATDGLYSFAYDAGDHSRTESIDSLGKVKGRFSFIAKDDGLTRTVDYTAGSDTGFIASGAHLPTTPTATPSSFAKINLPSPTRADVMSHTSEGSQDEETNGDASYSYSYETDSSSKQEISDSQGNVAGSFTFLNGDGVSRTIQYTSRGNEGFIANGDHLPKPGFYSASHVPQILQPKGNTLGIKTHKTVSGGDYSHKINSINQKSFAHIKNAVLSESKTSDYLIHTYLPPDSEKFGYIFDTKRP